MRRARATYQDAYHHVMNRGVLGKPIFAGKADKKCFLRLLKRFAKRYKIKIIAYCIMDNHYHLLLQNTSDKMIEFMKQLNARYGTCYRESHGGRGYVFQGRFKSTLIQPEKYMKTAVCYLLLNPVRAGIVQSPEKYEWSSIGEYFNKKITGVTDKNEVEGLFGSRRALKEYIEGLFGKDIKTVSTRIGLIIGDKKFCSRASRLYERRTESKSTSRRRINDYTFSPAAAVIKDFEKEYKCKTKNLDLTTWRGKRIRAALLVRLRDSAGLKYSEILKLPLFRDYKYGSLSVLCRRARGKAE